MEDVPTPQIKAQSSNKMARLRDRAHTVCVHCHTRKVKCDLEDSRDNTCSNCRRFKHSCIRRTGARKRTRAASPRRFSQISVSPQNINAAPGDARAEPALEFSPRLSNMGPLPSPESTRDEAQPKQQTGFIAAHSVLAFHELTQPTVSEGSISQSLRVRDAILSATEAEILPVPALRRALTDAFFEQVFHNYAIISQEDVSSSHSSILLQQAVCLSGSLTRHGPESMHLAHTLYEKVKTLLYLDYETDNLTTLKALCLLSCWSVKPPDKISLDGPWYWTGVAIRLALQMGLHRESTYLDNPHAPCLRRIFWHLHTADKLQMACWGRPPSFGSKYYDVKPLTMNDFDVQNIQSKAFLQTTKLCAIIGQIADLQLERRSVSQDEVLGFTQKLRRWLQDLPDDLHLYDFSAIKRPFCFATSELFIKYFGAIVMLQLLQGEVNEQRVTSVRSLVAASCMARLYEEINIRERSKSLLPIHGFFCMLASIPQIYYRPRCAEKERVRQEEIGILCSIMESIRGKYGGSEMVLHKIRGMENQVHSSMEQMETDTNGVSDSFITQHGSESLENLFPFPLEICSQMELIHQSVYSETESSMQNFLPMENEWANWLVTEGHGFVDLLGLLQNVPDTI
ncbi:hypothetical protein AAEP93_002743 [Penicillium crustosum]